METFPCKVLMKLLSKFMTGLTGAMLTFNLINSDPQVDDPGTESPFVDIPMPYIKYITMLNIQMHVGAIRKLSYNLCVCMGANQISGKDNPTALAKDSFAKAGGLFSRTDAHTIQLLTRIECRKE